MSFKIISCSMDEKSEVRKIQVTEPSICPHCSIGILPIVIFAGHFIDMSHASRRYPHGIGTLTAVLKCPKCSNFSFAQYNFAPSSNEVSLIQHYPHEQKTKLFPIEISEVSPQFNKIYNQALQSETYLLDEISGIAYRKALEFLIKDYLIYISTDTNEIEKIKNELLSESIKRLDDDCRCLALAATWLGNDHTHYMRRFDGRTIEEMKIFIDFVTSDIHRMIVLKNAKKFIDGK